MLLNTLKLLVFVSFSIFSTLSSASVESPSIFGNSGSSYQIDAVYTLMMLLLLIAIGIVIICTLFYLKRMRRERLDRLFDDRPRFLPYLITTFVVIFVLLIALLIWHWFNEIHINYISESYHSKALFSEIKRMLYGSLMGTIAIIAFVTAFSVWLSEIIKDRLEAKVEHRTAELREAEYTKELALDAAQVGLWSGNIQTDVLEWDRRVAEMMGLPDNNYPDLASWFSVIHPDDFKYVVNEFQTAIRGEKAYDVEYRVILLTGEVRYITARGKMIRDDDGEPLRIDGITLDMTELRQTEHDLKDSQERFELAVIGSGDALWEYDCHTKESWFSPQFIGLLGYKEGELANTLETWESHVHPDDKEYVAKAFLKHIHSDAPYDIEYRIRSKHDEWRWFRGRAKSLRDEKGFAYRVSGTISDITERKNAEASLRESEQSLELALRSANTGLWDWDIVNGVLKTNEIWSEMLGYQHKKLQSEYGRTFNRWEALIHRDDIDMVYEHFTEHFESKSLIFKCEFRMKAFDDSWKWILAVGQVVGHDANGKPSRVIGTTTDISELISARHKAEEAANAKSDFLANMSHEIRTPMNAIICLSHLVLKTDLSTKQRDYIIRLQSSANALLYIINDILDFSKIEAGRLGIENINFQLEDVLSNLANLVAIKAEEKGLELLFKIDEDVPAGLVGDPLRLGQVLINLADNAVKFTEEGEIIVSVSIVQKDETKVTLQFSVKDSGIGLTKEQCGRLFQAFSQADTSTTRKFGGTGLGLAICKKLCAMMGGDILVDSVYGEGSTFIFTSVFGLHSEKKIPLLPEPDLRNKLALVVDNNMASREILQSMLESMTFKVCQATSGIEAVDEIMKADLDGVPFDVVFMDWQMPGMDGIAASQRIRKQNISIQPKIIMVTAYGREDVMQQVQDISLDGFMVKPVSRSMLFDATMQAFGKEGIKTHRAKAKEQKEIEVFKNIGGARILLAEDNETNQEVAKEILEQAALVVDLANSGREAIEKVENNQYDLVLMDIQMPEMSGLDATKTIRDSSAVTKDIPIIAMTAHAMAGDREKSIAAGMNDHITKPINPNQLFDTLLRWIKPAEREIPKYLLDKLAEQKEMSNKNALMNMPGIDVDSGLKRIGGNEKFYRKLLVKFYNDNLKTMEQIHQAFAKDDKELVALLVHNVKGVAGNIGANGLQAASYDVEVAIRNNEFEKVEGLLKVFERKINGMLKNLKGLISEEEVDIIKEKEKGDPDFILESLQQLISHLKKKKPKPSKEIMEQINNFVWPPEYQQEIDQLTKLISKYKFAEANELVTKLITELE